MNNIDIKQLVQENSSQYDSPDGLMGYGIPNMYKAYESVTGLNYLLSSNLKVHSIYPNPLGNEETLHLFISSHENQRVEITMLDDIGRSVHSIGFNLLVGKNKVEISNIKQVSAGVYRLRIADEVGHITHIPIVIY